MPVSEGGRTQRTGRGSQAYVAQRRKIYLIEIYQKKLNDDQKGRKRVEHPTEPGWDLKVEKMAPLFLAGMRNKRHSCG